MSYNIKSYMSQNSNLVSIVITTYKRNKLLRRALLSAVNQSYRNIEIIIVDDSPDGEAKDVFDSFTSVIEIKYFQSHGKGGNAARNLGIQSAVGNYIALLDDDDEFVVDKIEFELNFLNDSRYKWCYGAAEIVHDKGSFIRQPKYRPFVNYLLGVYCQFSPPMTLIQRECFENVGLFDESMPALQDWEMWYRISKKYPVITHLKVVCKIHTEHEEVRVTVGEKPKQGYKIFYAKHFASLGFTQKILFLYKNRNYRQ